MGEYFDLSPVKIDDEAHFMAAMLDLTIIDYDESQVNDSIWCPNAANLEIDTIIGFLYPFLDE